MPQLALAFLIACGSTALRAQSDAELLAAARKEEHAHLQSLIESRDPKDRLRAVAGLDSLFMDYDQLWKLMNDTQTSRYARQLLKHSACTSALIRKPGLSLPASPGKCPSCSKKR